MRRRWWLVLVVSLALAKLTVAISAEPGKPDTDGGSLPAKSDRLREGTKLTNEKGTFEFDSTGDHAVFVLANGRKIRCLENLSLDRVWQVVHINPDRLEWTIQGTLTEYRGSNYLLVSQALLLTRRTSPRQP